mmetsp:Transcript_3123/g.7259  ORF Transcript_3123/g.7259 Transcript_3123/m.7259 type:complete len:217 (-) Transcript_3123:882-1532(-)|eukprot:g13929.t1
MCCHDELSETAGEDELRSTMRGTERTDRKSSSRELRGSIESDSTYSSYESEALPYDEDLVVVSNRHVGCCYCFYSGWWVMFGGIWMFIFWCLAGLLSMLTIFGFCWGKKCFQIACICLLPWKKTNRGVIKKHIYYIRYPRANGFGIALWYICSLFLSLMHLVFALLNVILIVGIPFAYQHVKWAIMVWRCGQFALTLEEAEAISGIDAKAGSDSEE